MLERTVIVLLFIFGILGIAYGMWKERNLSFIVGLVCVIGGYLLVRRKLKQSVREKTYRNETS
jgi:hypothetical protein